MKKTNSKYSSVKRLPKPKAVAVLLNLDDASGRSSLRGVLRYVNGGRRWKLKIVADFERITAAFVDELKSAGVDGVVAGLPEASGCFRELLVSDLPVSFNVLPEEFPVAGNAIRRTAFTDVDNASIAAAAADHLAYRGGFKSVAFVSDRAERRWSYERERAFRAIARERKWDLRAFTCTSDERPLDSAALGAFLNGLPKPAAVWCVYDVTALAVAEACEAAGLAIPAQVAVLGTDNDEVLCRFASPNLSSVAVNHEELGYESARVLDRLMEGRAAPKRPLFIRQQPDAVVERNSTRRIPPAAHLVDRALDFIRARASDALSADDVARHLGVSRQLLDLRFRQVRDTSVGREIRAARLAEIKRLLAETDLSASQIAARCGFPSAAQLAHFFKRVTGMTTGEWKRLQSHAGCG